MLTDDRTSSGNWPETHLSLLHCVGQVLADSASPQGAMERIIQTVCSTLLWDYGACWHEDEQTHHVTCTQMWHEPFLANFEFVEITRAASFVAGPGGLIRTVLRTRQPFLIEDIALEPGLRRGPAAINAGLRSAFAFPLLAGGETLGAMEFFSREQRRQDARLSMTGATIGAIIGEYVARRQAEDRYRELVELSIERDSQRRTEASALQENERAMSTLLRNLPGMAYRCRLDERWTMEFVSGGCIHLTGYHAEDLIDNRRLSFIDLVHPDDRGWVIDEIRDKLERGDRFVIQYQMVCADGSVKWVSQKAQAIRDDAGRAVSLEGIIDDVTDRKRFEERLAYLAQYDVLTGLPNRSLFYDRLRQAIVRARREQTMVGLLFLDLDRFKQINDTLGHSAGDRLLQAIAERLKGFLREVDTIARLGGDEFTVIIEGVDQPEQVSAVAEKIKAALADPIPLEGRDIFVSASIGISLYPRDAEDIEHLVKNADIAMYHAKHRGGQQQFRFYDEGMAPPAVERQEREAKLKRAIENEEFAVLYQPIAGVVTGRITGMEALIRWQSPEGLVLPADFLPLAEESGLALDIGKWTLKAACAQARKWQKEGLPPLRLSVNLSPLQFREQNLLETVSETLRETGLGPDYLELEIAESTIMERAGETIVTLTRLEKLGVHLSIDDFGTGYSSLAYLKQFPVHRLKIDKSFIHDVTVDSDNAAIVSAMIAMATNLGLEVTAEGVETKDQLGFLRNVGCDTYQGYYLSVPLPAHAFAELMKKQAREYP